MDSDPETPDDADLDAEEGMTRPEPTDDAAPGTSPDEVEPAFAVDLEPDEQGLAETGDEPTA